MASCLPKRCLTDLVLEYLLEKLDEEVDADPDLKVRLEKKEKASRSRPGSRSLMIRLRRLMQTRISKLDEEAAALHLHNVWLENTVAADPDFKVWLEQKVAREEKS